jgi:hypothetical protein
VGSAFTLEEIRTWKRLGVATLPGPTGRKGPRHIGWPTLPHWECWQLSEKAARRTAANLLVRTGPTFNGQHTLAAIDLDGKCDCGHDLDDHDGACHVRPKVGDGSAPCECPAYTGCHPDEALAFLRALLPATIAISKTARGFHVIFWAKEPVANGVIRRLSSDLKGGATPNALQVPPSRHPSGRSYCWLQPPGEDLPVVDLRSLGLVADGPELASPEKRQRSRYPGQQVRPAPIARQQEFQRLMYRLGIERGIDDEFVHCPWHTETQASLHVTWTSAVFYCFGCGKQGGVRQLRSLVPPGCDPGDGLFPLRGKGLQAGGSGITEERGRLADGLRRLGEDERAARVAGCREAAWEDPEAFGVYRCPSGDAAPVLRRMNSCDDHMCPCCMPWRFASDWSSRSAAFEPSTSMSVFLVEAITASRGLDDPGYANRVREKFREWRRARELDGFYGVFLQIEGEAWRALIILAVPTEEARQVSDGRAFGVSELADNVTLDEVGRIWQRAYLNEACQWDTPDELRSFRELTRGRRKFQGFGELAPREPVAEQARDAPPISSPVGRVAGGSGRAGRPSPKCPRCGERLRFFGPFDPAYMHIARGSDGLLEWHRRDAGGRHPPEDGLVLPYQVALVSTNHSNRTSEEPCPN